MNSLQNIYLSWQEFKTKFNDINDDEGWIYRGQANDTWKLDSTLSRYINRPMRASHYFSVLQQAHEALSTLPNFQEMILPEKNPFQIGLMIAHDDHLADLLNTFDFMIQLRHLGFPTPILDWTKIPFTAMFFAATEYKRNDLFCVYRTKVMKEISTPFGKQIHLIDGFSFPDINQSSTSQQRHNAQESQYTLALQHEHRETVTHEKPGPAFIGGPYEFLDPVNSITTEKYIIIDSKEQHMHILKELYKMGKSYQAIYKETHPVENTILKDLALKLLLLDTE